MAKYHQVIHCKIKTDTTGVTTLLPVIFTTEGLLLSHLRFLLEHKTMSQSWIQSNTHAIGLLLDYNIQNKSAFDQPVEMFKNFSNRLFTGTVDEAGSDPSGLYWRPRSIASANKIIGQITAFSDWLAKDRGDIDSALNPWRQASKHEEMLNWAAWAQRKEHAFLKHLWKAGDQKTQAQNKLSRTVRNRIRPKAHGEEVKKFPEKHIGALLHHGFVMPGCDHEQEPWRRLNLRDVMITYLMHYGGIRTSENFHIYLCDITPDPNAPASALVKVYDPVNGQAPTVPGSTLNYANRADFLRLSYQMEPRNFLPKSAIAHAGWKHPLLDFTQNGANFFKVQWAPRSAGETFLKLHEWYLRYQRVSPDPDQSHPFYFTSLRGQPYTIRAFQQAHAKSVERIGLEPSKHLGTSCHGHRHAYGARLEQMDVGAKVKQRAMHHQSIESSKIYSDMTADEVRQALDEAFKNQQAITFNE